MLDRMKEVFRETLLQMQGELLEFNGDHDHVHLMVAFPPQTALSAIVGKLKGKSSYVIRNEFWALVKKKLWGVHFWSPSYCALSCGGAPLHVLKEYIQNQRTPPSELQLERSKRFTGKTRKNGKWEPLR